jgi:hypothetical protein
VVPNTRQIEQQVLAVLQHDADASAVGIYAPRTGGWPERIRVGAREFRLAWCESSLAAREALIDRPDGEGLVLLTAADDTALGADLLARLSRGRVFHLQSWELVRDLFRARDIDPRLAPLGWIADLLVERAPTGGYAPAPGGFLSADVAWQQVLGACLGLNEGRPDALALVEWTLREDASARFGDVAPAAQADLAGWLQRSAGPAARPIVACVAAGRGGDVLPIGLVCELVFRAGSERDPALSAGAARLERYTDGQRVDPVAGRHWAEAAAAALNRLAGRARALLARADRILEELGLSAQAEASDLLQAGFDARLGRYAETLAAALPAPEGPPLERAEAAAGRVLSHKQAASWPLRCERLRMSLRLLRWLAGPEQAPGDFAAAAEGYAGDSAFADLARMSLLGGEDIGALSAAYAVLTGAVRARRERFNRRFAEHLAEWNRSGAARPGLVPVEEIIGSLLAPLAAQSPVLLLVADGMSLPVFRALAESLTGLGWSEAAPVETPRPVAGVSVLPTVTEASRTSLLCGRLTLGNAIQEKSCFSSHPALTAVSRPTARPVLFHKSDLGDGGGLAETVREAIRARDQKVVGVVYNAVDDHLSGSDQLHQTWTVDDLRLLGPLLHEARLAGRALLITADHGHVLEDGTTQRGREENARWRSGSKAAEGEVELSGGRVLAPGGAEPVILPWSEGVRYAGKRNGYHGGATPQEVLVPLTVLLPAAQDASGWRTVPTVLPAWWEAAHAAAQTAAPARPVPPAAPTPRGGRRRRAVPGQDDLFDAPPAAAAAPDPAWVDTLLASPAYAAQKRLAARIAPADEELRRFLLALDSRGGKLSKSALAQRLGLPMVRIEGFLSAVRRVLNVDRSAVISVDPAAGTVELNLSLLRVQFQLEAG